MKRNLIILVLVFAFSNLFSQIPTGYYDNAEGLSGDNLKLALRNIIDGHTSISYSGLWSAYYDTDATEDGYVWDIYSNCTFTFGSDQCGSYSNICDCYNREHTVPQSWFGSASPMVSDLFQVLPTDGKVNGYRSNYPYGECDGGTLYGTGKLGACTYSGYSSTVFEPADEYKGDVARIYFYMATRYNVSSWNGESFSGDGFTDWTKTMLLEWHEQDPVSQKEIDRNNVIYSDYQHNRNPFVDHPEFACLIWGTNCPSSLQFTSAPIETATENVLYSYTISYSGDGATLTCPTCPAWLTFTAGASGIAKIEGTPTAANIGSHSVSLKLSDGTDDVYQNFTIVVGEDVISFISNPITSIVINNQYLYTISYTGSNATLTCPTSPAWLTFTPGASGVAKIQGTPTTVGNYNVVLNLSDGTETVNQSFTIQVIENTEPVTIFDKDFEDQSLTSGGWLDISVIGTETWEILDDTYGYYAFITGWVSGDGAYENEDWLISPAVNFDNYSGEVLTFYTAFTYTGNDLQLFYSNNYSGTGDPNSATWTEITDFSLAVGSTWTESGEIDVSAISGENIRFGFKYTSDNTNARDWQLDDIMLEGIETNITQIEITSTPVQMINEGQLYTYNITYTGDNVSLTTPTIPTWLAFTDNQDGTAVLTGTPSHSDLGEHDVSLLLSDGTTNVNQNYAILVSEDILQFISSPVETIEINNLYSYTIEFSGYESVLTCPTSPEWLTFTSGVSGEAKIEGTPNSSHIGTHSVSLKVYNDFNEIFQNFDIEVTGEAVEITSTPITQITEGQDYTYNITYTGENATVSATTIPNWLNIADNEDGTAVLSGTPANSDIGNHNVVLSLTDGYSTDLQEFSITVYEDILQFTSTPITTIDVNNLYSYVIYFSGNEADLTCEEKPEWLTFTDGESGFAKLEGTPNTNYLGNHSVSLKIANGTSEILQDFEITVTGVEVEITSIPITAVNQETEYIYNISYTGENAILTCPTLPSWLIFTDNEDGTAILTGTPSVSDVGENQVELVLTDGFTSDEQNFVITVYEDTYMFTSTPITEIQADIYYLYQISYIGSQSYVVCNDKPDWLNFTDNEDGTALLSGMPNNENVGTYSVELELIGGTSSVFQNFEIEVIFNPLQTIFNKDFNDNDLTSGGWKAYSIVGNGQIWTLSETESSFDNTYFAYIDGNTQENEDWLISPEFVPDNYIEKTLTFWTKSQNSGEDLSLLYSLDYSGSGNPNNAIWTEISDFILAESNEWTFSDNIDVSDISGNKAFIAFLYTSTTTDAKRWEIDNIFLKGILNEDNIDEISDNLNLSVYPNPFNDYLNINYIIANNTNVIIDIYDITGKKIDNIENSFKTSGDYQINWNPEKITQNGIYFINIKTDYQNNFIKIIYQN